MIWRPLIIAITAFVVGWFAHWGTFKLRGEPQSIADHWRVVLKYRDRLLNPAGYKPDAQTGFSMTTLPPNPEPSLFALVNARELEHVDLVFPNVRMQREANLYWMQFANEHDDIIHALGNSEYADYQIAGDQPMHLQLWFRPKARPLVQQLIKELESRFSTKSLNGAEKAASE